MESFVNIILVKDFETKNKYSFAETTDFPIFEWTDSQSLIITFY